MSNAPKKYRQLSHRHAPDFVRHLLELHRSGQLDTPQVCGQLGLGKGQFHRLRASCLLACASARPALWQPQSSGGARHPQWPSPAQELALKLLKNDPPASCSLASGELHRRLSFETDRSSVRRWQRQSIGGLWQMDATPHAFVTGSETKWHLIGIIDRLLAPGHGRTAL